MVRAVSYFRANERYLSGAGEPEVAPPWGVRVQEAGLTGCWLVTWRPPYTPVDSYGVYGQAADDPAGAWQPLLRVPGATHEALLHLGPGTWRVAVAARRGATDSPFAIADCGLRKGDWVAGAAEARQPAPVVGAAAPTEPSPPPTLTEAPAPTPNPPPPTPIAEPAPELDWTAIDTALRENSARLGRHGLFVRDRR